MFREETIAAVATAYGEGGIGIVRISGCEARSILSKVFIPAKSRHLQNRKLTYGTVKDPDSGEMIDEAMAVFFPSPNTYTREDVAEINCHGSVVALRKTLDLVLRQGAALAEPGEFTKRAFLNGRIDLAQAEAVIDLVKAKAARSFDSAVLQLEGKLSQKVREIRERLLSLLVHIAVNLDYPDEDIEEVTFAQLTEGISQISDMIENLLITADTGRIVKEGLKVVIAGSPNVGKSSLLNALLKESRAIVTEIPGTTRDIIEEGVSIRGIPVRIFDTAGIRSTEDAIERIGIEKSREAFSRADLILLMVDGSEGLSCEDLSLLADAGGRQALVLINKTDIDKKIYEKQIHEILPNCDTIDTSVIDDVGINEIEEKIVAMVYGGKVSQSESLLVTNARHKDLLLRASSALGDARRMAEAKAALDFIEVDVRAGFEFLGEIVGETASDDIINEVFSNFCLGK
ncbi:MAG: tRNA uridine-5-carboxymethylaminomethyl(34) synthesis GTPase MnmE [Clostridiales bacterium]|nr:tRNA uridine-5-carboxymethylaminomethyl(34) synthesis GTPase MnmE [Clostridiales bacterium]